MRRRRGAEGWWFVPSGQGRGTVIVMHGHTDNRTATLGLAELLVADGYRVLAPDARRTARAGGQLATYGVLERGDLRMWADWAQRQALDECLFGAGSSMGGAILIETLPTSCSAPPSPTRPLRISRRSASGASARDCTCPPRCTASWRPRSSRPPTGIHEGGTASRCSRRAR